MLKILYIILTFIAAQTHSLNESDLSPLRAYPSNGVWRYERLVLNYQNFVDKSLLIKDFLQSDQVIAVSRPHRWGKTLNTDMLVKFLQVELDSNGSLITDNSNKILFEGGFICTENSSRSLQPLKIAKYPEILDNHQGKHYVIKLNFLLGYGMDEVALNRELGLRVRKLFYECKSLHQYFETKYTTKQGCDKKNLRAFINSDLGTMDAGKGFTWLLDCIGAHFNTTVYVFIDEYHHVSESAYSAWLHQGRTKNETYRKFCTYLGNIYTSIFKNTKNVRGLITGTSIAPMRELSKYTDLSFIKEDSLLNPIFTEHYGFIDEEIDALLSNSCLKAKSKDVKHHYRGYIVGDKILYNPLTIIECLGYNHIGSYWTKVFGSIDEYIPDEIKAEVSTLMYSNTNVTIKIPSDIPHCLNFHEKESKDVIYTRSLILGLFKAVPVSGGYYNFSMANNEIRNYTFNRMISHWLERGLGEKEICYWRWGSKFAMKLTNYEMENVEREINDDLRRFLLPRNTTDYDILEKFYNDFMTLVTFPVTSKFILNREFSINDKRTDLVLIPETSDEKKQDAVIVGYTIAESNETMSSKSVSILASLQSSNVYRNLQQNTRIKQIYSIGMAFHKIEAKVSHRVDPNPNYHSS